MKTDRFRLMCGILSLLCTAASSAVRADDFAVVPAGDPIYGNLSSVARFASSNATSTKGTSPLTRYEAALQTARVLLYLSVKESNGGVALSREQGRALKELISALRPELRRLDTDPDSSLAMIDRLISRPVASRSSVPAPEERLLNSTIQKKDSLIAERKTTPKEPGLSLGISSVPDRNFTAPQSVNLELSRRLRATAALLAMQRETQDPFGDAASASGFFRHTGPALTALSSSATGVSYDFNSWLSVRASGEQRSLRAAADTGSLLSAPLFNGADKASASGAGVDVTLGNIKLSTELSRLSASNGNEGTSVGGGLGLNAWQNRLSLSAHLAHLEPADSAALAATAAELNIGVDVTRRLSLSMLYQGLFTEQRASSNSRVAGGLTLNF